MLGLPSDMMSFQITSRNVCVIQVGYLDNTPTVT